jgi:hypothetical protein
MRGFDVKMKKAVIAIMAFLLCLTPVFGADVNFGDLERVLMSRLDINKKETIDAINVQADRCRTDMAVWGDEQFEDKKWELKKSMMLDRALTFFLVFLGVFLGGTVVRFREHKAIAKMREVERITDKNRNKEVLDKFEKASTTAKWNGVEVVAVKKEYFDLLKEGNA